MTKQSHDSTPITISLTPEQWSHVGAALHLCLLRVAWESKADEKMVQGICDVVHEALKAHRFAHSVPGEGDRDTSR
ncbi:MAG: hypothetical protein EOO38_09540 [Cytophagaceae bacterium]|nr:MAG: hypothetical protein EOO38_09540 [Cytophagaceae bacterium]